MQFIYSYQQKYAHLVKNQFEKLFEVSEKLFEVSEKLLQDGNVAENKRQLGDFSFIPNSSRGEPNTI